MTARVQWFAVDPDRDVWPTDKLMAKALETHDVAGVLADLAPRHPDYKVREQVEELLDWVDVFHREGLGRLVELIRAWRGEVFLENVAEDEVAGAFLALYDLGEAADDRDAAEAEEAVLAALDELKGFVESHGGTIALESIRDGVVTVRMLGSCDGCPSSNATLTGGVEEALRRLYVEMTGAGAAGPQSH